MIFNKNAKKKIYVGEKTEHSTNVLEKLDLCIRKRKLASDL